MIDQRLNHFRIVQKIGSGGWGDVYRAHDEKLERDVAIKVLRSEADSPASHIRLIREARIASQLNHPNICTIYEIGEAGGYAYIAMELLVGEPLNVRVERGPLTPEDTIRWGQQFAAALAYAHDNSVVHRDFKSNNVVLTSTGQAKVVDFGLAKRLSFEEISEATAVTLDSLTQAGTLVGTLAYMAPELLRGEPASERSDIWALGVVLYEMASGRRPFQGQTVFELSSSILNRDAPPLPGHIPVELCAVIGRCLQKEPERRYQRVDEIGKALGAATKGPKISSGRNRLRTWTVSSAFALLVLFLLIGSVKNFLTLRLPGRAPTMNRAHGDYLKAEDLLEHYYKPNNLEQAVSLFQKAVGEDPKFALAYAGLGRTYWYKYRSQRQSQFIEPARTNSEHALELDRNLAFAHVTLGMIYTQSGKKDLASAELQNALRVDSTNADAYGALADLYDAQGRDADVEPALQKAVDLSPTQWRWLNQLGQYYLSKGKPEAAALQFLAAVKLAPDNATAYNNLGVTYARQGRWTDAQAVYEKSLQIAPAYNTTLNLGEIFEGQGDYSKAIAMYLRSAELNPSSYVAFGELASAYSVLGQKAKAQENALKAIALAEEFRKGKANDPLVLADIGGYYAEIGMEDKAVPLLRQAVALAPMHPQILYITGKGYETLHRRKDALFWIGKALQNGLSMDALKRSHALAGLIADPQFPVMVKKALSQQQ